MKYLLLTSSLTLSLLFSAGSWAEWTKVADNFNGSGHLVDFDRIKEFNGLVYFWTLTEYLEPRQEEILSIMTYFKGDCDTPQTMTLKMSSFKFHRAEGDSNTFPIDPYQKWKPVLSDSISETILDAVCAHTRWYN